MVKTSKRKKKKESLDIILSGIKERLYSIRVEEPLKESHTWVCGLTDDDTEDLTYYRFETNEEALQCKDAILNACKEAGLVCEEGEAFGENPTIVYLQAEEV